MKTKKYNKKIYLHLLYLIICASFLSCNDKNDIQEEVEPNYIIYFAHAPTGGAKTVKSFPSEFLTDAIVWESTDGTKCNLYPTFPHLYSFNCWTDDGIGWRNEIEINCKTSLGKENSGYYFIGHLEKEGQNFYYWCENPSQIN